jgi:hypothetical protein
LIGDWHPASPPPLLLLPLLLLLLLLLLGAGVPVTALASDLLRGNTTQLAVGLQQGSVLLLQVAHESTRYVCLCVWVGG